ncbi:MAG TPA: hypothetical protein VMT34_03270 [Aggregatilineales bacterium]|nr:hypothetical protein [Aggregatilineales bacterium]
MTNNIQALLIAAGQNIKRLVKACRSYKPLRPAQAAALARLPTTARPEGDFWLTQVELFTCLDLVFATAQSFFNRLL